MNRLLFIISALMLLLSCDKDGSGNTPDPSEELISIEISVSYGAAMGSEDLIALQIYNMVDGIEEPYAYGLFDSIDDLSFLGYDGNTYKISSTIVIDGKSEIYLDGETYGKPFNTSLTNEFVYSDQELLTVSSSEATLEDGNIYDLPTLDRYYGQLSQEVSSSDAVMSLYLKRVSFGFKVEMLENIGTDLILKVDGAPDVTISESGLVIYSLSNIIAAYNYTESGDDIYSEDIALVITTTGGTVIFSQEVNSKRDQAAVITATLDSDSSIKIEMESPFEDSIVDPGTPYISKIFDYVPAPGQFVNQYPTYEDGDTKESIIAKIEASVVGKANNGMVALGGFGGYMTFGFDHMVENKANLSDLRIYGNAFTGSSEPAIVMVSYDENGNGEPDDTWYEIKGSEHDSDATIYDYTITYTRPTSDDDTDPYIAWSDNQGGSGSIEKNIFHSQSYYPQWESGESLTFTGTRLPDIAVNTAEAGADYEYWILSEFAYGYADNADNSADNSTIDIDWAVDADGNAANLEGIHFVKVYNSQNQIAGWLGDVSPEICGAEDLHLLEIEITPAQ